MIHGFADLLLSGRLPPGRDTAEHAVEISRLMFEGLLPR